MLKRTSKTPTENTRKKLMKVAAQQFGLVGYSAATMRHIADKAGIEAASIYYHFSSKEELVDAVLEHGALCITRHIYNHIRRLPEGSGAESIFRAALTGQLTGLIRYGDYAVVQGRLNAQLPEKVQLRQAARRERHQEFWDGLLHALRAEGVLKGSVDIALCRVFVLSSINSAASWFNPRKGSAQSVIDQLCFIFFDGVRSDTPQHR